MIPLSILAHVRAVVISMCLSTLLLGVYAWWITEYVLAGLLGMVVLGGMLAKDGLDAVIQEGPE